ncbi:2-hydroxyacid dehydrogenase [Alloacidobacterium sp.]|uniref:2-hydroxyacid dehydrogenase n=1 Tax=Alloacidobacterium sp. TaxID=2951999 RepID=UPI002D6BCCC9|nr:2-hydroxyacid dehydrogenase [Alloacidobacterium sp.]HYK35390.1 2-hydroxyacid dehydrogenase [Alloacidobacterium sp.]
MVKVGVPHWAEDYMLAKLPADADVCVLPKTPSAPVEIDFWAAPLFRKDAEPVAPYLRGVKVVQSLQAGVDWLRSFVPPGAVLCDAQGAHNVATSEWTASAILAMTKFLPFYFDLHRNGKWVSREAAEDNYRSIYRTNKRSYPPVLIEELAGKTVMIVGYGSIGRSIEERLVPFGVNVIRVARSAKPGVEPAGRLKELLPTADVIVLIVPLTPETRHLIDADAIACMKQGALLVNAARGSVIDTDALVKALTENRIRAALDVTDPEPLPAGHPLWNAPNLLLTPHVGGSSPLYMSRAFDLVAEQVKRFASGEPLKNVVKEDY